MNTCTCKQQGRGVRVSKLLKDTNTDELSNAKEPEDQGNQCGSGSYQRKPRKAYINSGPRR